MVVSLVDATMRNIQYFDNTSEPSTTVRYVFSYGTARVIDAAKIFLEEMFCIWNLLKPGKISGLVDELTPE